MRNYSFLLKPIFFIFSLLFATWLVVAIEEISPSDFGQKAAPAQETTGPENVNGRVKHLQNLCAAYKGGIIDSTALYQKLTIFLELDKSASFK